ncbi:hypothetical protein K402DRAFT_152598 [Aulographum hederae CBS 113979]|uniref:Uncharacterized protein n=1 Tax=Aulographum hederae CBS 113979 TaxID=1176131 RepID=A0A6G1GSN1_9PEZI|nr:hypothetical protein K402DRAFT_152598 [Aulographum hederae CBS 113979]
MRRLRLSVWLELSTGDVHRTVRSFLFLVTLVCPTGKSLHYDLWQPRGDPIFACVPTADADRPLILQKSYTQPVVSCLILFPHHIAMNWTGGKLQLHSRKSDKSVIDRQRQHFAKARTKLRNGSSPSVPLFKPSFLRDNCGTLNRSVATSCGASQRETGHSKDRQSRLEEFENIAPVVDRLSSLGKSSKAQTPHAHYVEKPSPYHALRGYGDTIARQERRANPPVDPHKREHFRQSKKRKARDESTEVTEQELLEANKRRLLGKSDWAGLLASRPLQMKFRSHTEKDKIGKRRRVRGRGNRRHHRENETETKIPIRDADNSQEEYFMSGAIINDPENVKIGLGTEALASQVSSRAPLSQVPQSVGGVSSDSMLLDDEVEQGQQLVFVRASNTEVNDGEHPMEIGSSNSDSSLGSQPPYMEAELARSIPPADSHGEDFDHTVVGNRQGHSIPAQQDLMEPRVFAFQGGIGSLCYASHPTAEAVEKVDFGRKALPDKSGLHRLVFRSSPSLLERQSKQQDTKDPGEPHSQLHEQAPTTQGIQQAREAQFENDLLWRQWLAVPVEGVSESSDDELRGNERDNTHMDSIVHLEPSQIPPHLHSNFASMGDSNFDATIAGRDSSPGSSITTGMGPKSQSLKQLLSLKRNDSSVQQNLFDDKDKLWKRFVFGTSSPGSNVLLGSHDSETEDTGNQNRPRVSSLDPPFSKPPSAVHFRPVDSDSVANVPMTLASEHNSGHSEDFTTAISDGMGSMENNPSLSQYFSQSAKSFEWPGASKPRRAANGVAPLSSERTDSSIIHNQADSPGVFIGTTDDEDDEDDELHTKDLAGNSAPTSFEFQRPQLVPTKGPSEDPFDRAGSSTEVQAQSSTNFSSLRDASRAATAALTVTGPLSSSPDPLAFSPTPLSRRRGKPIVNSNFTFTKLDRFSRTAAAESPHAE